MTHRTHSYAAGTLALGLAIFLTACGGPPAANQLVTEAQTAYQRIADDQEVRQHAPVAVEEAREALNRAQSAWQQRERRELVDHYAYVAQQRAQIARQRARMNAAQAAIRSAEDERRELQLQARTAEAEAAEARARAERQRAEAARAAAEAAMQRAQELDARVAELEAELTNRGLVLTLSDVLFDVGRAQLRAGNERTLNELAAFLQEYPERAVLIEGHTDSTGGRDLNMRLSRDRAAAVRTALVERGIPGTRIRTVGLGPDYPVASNATSEGRQQNRRVEIIISDADGNIPDRSPPGGN